MERDIIRASVEAMLFASGDPVSRERMADILEISAEAVDDICDELRQLYDETGSALQINRMDGQYQLSTRSSCAEPVRALLDSKKEQPLSSAAMEALAVIAYNEPVTRNFVERVRGVDCSGVINTLLSRGMIEERGRLDLPGKPMQYATSSNFMRCFGLESMSDLPPVPSEAAESVRAAEESASEGDGQ